MASNPNLLQQLLSAARWRLRSWEDIKSTSLFTKANYINIFLFLLFVALAIYQVRSKMQMLEKANEDARCLPAPDFPQIEGLSDFSWQDEEPLKQRPFKPKYHLTMALQKLNPSELILVDKTYSDRILYRKVIMREKPDSAIGVNDESRIGPAVRELYTWLMGTYLPKRYPTMFKLHKAHFETGDTFMLENLVTKKLYPAKAQPQSSTRALLETLGGTIDEEFLLLLPERDVEEGKDPKYRLEAYLTISASGFDLREKIGKKLAEIHRPVPAYQEIIEGSMDRYFTKVKVGEYVSRTNWTITTNPDLSVVPGVGSNHAHEGDVLEQLETIDPDKTWLRSERQTLHRLPKSEALVFGFHTYMYTLKDIKEEGSGEELAQAIDGMKAGNAPGIFTYKKGGVWGEAVKKYLRS